MKHEGGKKDLVKNVFLVVIILTIIMILLIHSKSQFRRVENRECNTKIDTIITTEYINRALNQIQCKEDNDPIHNKEITNLIDIFPLLPDSIKNVWFSAFLSDALKKFDNKDYDEAEIIFARIIRLKPDSSIMAKSLYWYGVSEYEKGKFETAIGSCKAAVLYGDSIEKERAQFRIGLSFLRIDSTHHAKYELQKVIEMNRKGSELYNRAKKLIDELKCK